MESPQRPVVLVCDDELGPRLSFQMILKRTCDVVLADRPAAALEALGQQRFDVALIDWYMSDEGYAAHPPPSDESSARFVRALHAIDPTLSVIVCSAYGLVIERAVREAGAGRLILKPPQTPRELEQAVLDAAAQTASRRGAS